MWRRISATLSCSSQKAVPPRPRKRNSGTFLWSLRDDETDGFVGITTEILDLMRTYYIRQNGRSSQSFSSMIPHVGSKGLRLATIAVATIVRALARAAIERAFIGAPHVSICCSGGLAGSHWLAAIARLLGLVATCRH
jgi:hypothetical protein